MKNAQAKLIFAMFLIFILSAFLIYAVSTTLLSPSDFAVDDDGYLDLRGTCIPTTATSNIISNITNGTLYSNVDGTWKANVTLNVTSSLANNTYYFNFTNHINQSAEGEFKWNIQCHESNGSAINKVFAGNRTITVNYARPTVTTTSPADGTYSLNGHGIDVNGTAIASSGWNITSIDLLTTIRSDSNVGSGAGENWTVNQTFTPATATESQVVFGFTINKVGNLSISDGSDIIFGFRANQVKNLSGSGNEPLITSNAASANRTFNVEYPPLITLNKPATGNWSTTRTATLSWTVTSAFVPSGTTFLTRIWTNETGEWLPQTGTITATNNTAVTKTYVFPEKSYIDWTVEAIQSNDANVLNKSVNRTIRIDSTNPVILVTTQNLTTSDTTPNILATVTDANLDTLRVFTNFSGWKANYTNNSLITGVQANYFNNTAVVDGVYVYNFRVNDSAGNDVQTVNYSLIIDTILPTISSIGNQSVASKCDQRNINFSVSELATANLTYDTDIDVSDGTLVSSSTAATEHDLILDFDFNGEITYYFNITTTDVAGNVNRTHGQVTFQTPARVCSGWSQYAVYDSFINLSVIQNQSGADLVYFWNASNQEWVFKTAGLTTNDGARVGFKTDYHVVHLFENTNSTWYRNITNLGTYRYNLSIGSNFISVPRVYNFGNLTESFGNDSFNFPSFIPATYNGSGPTGDGGVINVTSLFGPFNVTFFAGYNNSLQDYVNHIFNFTWSNATFLEPCPNRNFKVTCMEAFWVASDYNITWNTSQISANWTI